MLDRPLRERYWTAQSHLTLARELLRTSNRSFAHHVARDYWRFLSGSVHPVQGEIIERVHAAVKWLQRAQDATPDDGVSLGYFPCSSEQSNGWQPSYPETTGYIIPSLLAVSKRFNDCQVRQRALRMAAWEIKIQMSSGAAQAGMFFPHKKQVPAVFNTGMVLHGYTAAYRATKAAEFVDAGRRAADFLLSDIGADGHLQTHGPFVRQERYKTYNCLCAWPLYLFGDEICNAPYRAAAVKIVEAAVREQRANGWFANNCLNNSNAPLLHTIAYTLQGVLEVGVLANRDDFLTVTQKGVDPLLERMSPEGFLCGRFLADWTSGTSASCLTGNAQLAVICYRLYKVTSEAKYKTAADSLLNYLKALQVLHTDHPGIHGAIPGSFPLLGAYMTAGYPNWATKYYIDALLLQDRLRHARGCPVMDA